MIDRQTVINATGRTAETVIGSTDTGTAYRITVSWARGARYIVRYANGRTFPAMSRVDALTMIGAIPPQR